MIRAQSARLRRDKVNAGQLFDESHVILVDFGKLINHRVGHAGPFDRFLNFILDRVFVQERADHPLLLHFGFGRMRPHIVEEAVHAFGRHD